MSDRFWIIFILILGTIFYVLDYKFDKANTVDEELLKSIKARGYLIAGVDTATRPFGYVENGKNIGFDVDIAHSIAKEIFHDSSKIRFVPVTSADRLYLLNAHKVDIVVATMTITPERRNLIAFSKPYFIAGQALLVKKGSIVRNLADLERKNVGVLFGTTAEKNIRLLVPDVTVRGYKTYDEAYNALKAGSILAITSDDTILRHYAISDPSVKLLPKRYTKEMYGIGVRKTSETESLLKLIDITISNMINDGSLTTLKRKWKLN